MTESPLEILVNHRFDLLAALELGPHLETEATPTMDLCDSSDSESWSEPGEEDIDSRLGIVASPSNGPISYPAAKFTIEVSKTQQQESASANRHSIDDCIEQFEQLEHSFVNVLSSGPNDGDDTVIFLKPPPQTPDQSKKLYDAILRRYQWPLFGRSEVFKRYAPEFYNTYFSVTYQPRYRRRFASWFNRHTDWNMRYALDLTPAIEGDEAIETVAQLQCPRGVLIWHQSSTRFGCKAELVDGPLDLESGLEIQAYSQVRHNLAIERILLAMHGHNPQFDSAIKVYTTAMLAKQFGILDSPLQDWVISWFSAANNSVFVEVLPEATLAIADSLQLGSLAAEAFAVLVGEACLEQDDSQKTTHNRKRYEIDETWQSRLQYAQQAFEKRVEAAFVALADEPEKWMRDMPEYRKLLEAEEAAKMCESGNILHGICQNLASMLTGIVHHCRDGEVTLVSSPGFDRQKNKLECELYGGIPYNLIWAWLMPPKRIFTRLFWRMMASIRLDHFYGDPAYNDVGFYDNFYLRSVRETTDQEPHSLGTIDGSLRRLRESLRRTVDRESILQMPAEDIFSDVVRSSIYDPMLTRLDTGKIRSALLRLESFSMRTFLQQAQTRIATQSFTMLKLPVGSSPKASELQLTNVLLCLDEHELRYLPLWAGGNDDGSGGVFDNDVPETFDGFTSHGPFIHLQNDVSSGDSEYSYVTQSTDIPSSREVNDGFSDTLDRRWVYAASDVASEISWTDVLEHRQKNHLERTAEVESLPETILHDSKQQTSTSSISDISADDFDVMSGSDVAEADQTGHNQ